ncbi:MAG: hypothetical protein ACYSTS_06805 [Planctomycetota bacterium]|jgi:hypothetical protein
MFKFSTFILCACFLLAGCITTQTSSDSHFEEVSREIARLKSETAKKASIGDNIRITVNLLSTNVEDYFAIDTLLQNVYGNVTVTKNSEIHAQSGLQVGIADGDFRAQLNITKRQLKSSEDTELFLVLADGATGNINVGREISVPRFYYFGQWYNGIEYEFKKAGRSIKVTVHRLPSGLIDMELTPVFSRFLSDGGNLEMTELSTKVVASPGEIVVIGGGDTTGENVANALLGFSKESEKKQTLITVTPQIR